MKQTRNAQKNVLLFSRGLPLTLLAEFSCALPNRTGLLRQQSPAAADISRCRRGSPNEVDAAATGGVRQPDVRRWEPRRYCARLQVGSNCGTGQLAGSPLAPSAARAEAAAQATALAFQCVWVRCVCRGLTGGPCTRGGSAGLCVCIGSSDDAERVQRLSPFACSPRTTRTCTAPHPAPLQRPVLHACLSQQLPPQLRSHQPQPSPPTTHHTTLERHWDPCRTT
jgi:hypothetical protein